MKILSKRVGFDADHSSSTYEFFALNRLTAEQRQAVQKLTGESARRHLRFHYRGDWSDIPAEWTDGLLTSGYDIMVSESYDWWAVYVSLPHNPALLVRLDAYSCDADGNGFSVRQIEGTMQLYFGMQLDYNAAYDAFGEDPFEGLAHLFETVREEVLSGDLSVVWATFKVYGGYVDSEPDPVKPLSDSAKTLLNVMERY